MSSATPEDVFTSIPEYPFGAADDAGVVYPLDEWQYGPRHKDNRPKGFPEWVPYGGGPGSAYLFVDHWCATVAAPAAFRDAVRDLARTESYGGRINLPGNPFDARRPGRASKVRRFGGDVDGAMPRGGIFSTAMGGLQWRGDTYETELPRIGVETVRSQRPDNAEIPAREVRPWDVGPADQIGLPCAVYLNRFWLPMVQACSKAGLPATEAARFGFLIIRLWHRNPSLTKRLMTSTAAIGPVKAWATMPVSERAHLDRRWTNRNPEHDIVEPGSGVVNWSLASRRWCDPYRGRS